MATVTDICNMALGHLGVDQTISSIDEDSSEARACNRFYEEARDLTMTEYRWPFTRKFKVLGLVEEDPTSEWSYSYRYPNDALVVRRIFSGVRNDTEDSEVPYILGQDSTGVLIYCDLNECEIEYTAKTTNAAFFPVDFAVALSLRLASFIAPQVAKGDQGNKLSAKTFQMYEAFCSKAFATRALEEKQDREPPDSFTRSRS